MIRRSYVSDLAHFGKSDRRWLWHVHTIDSRRSPRRDRLRRPRLLRHEEKEENVQEKGDGRL